MNDQYPTLFFWLTAFLAFGQDSFYTTRLMRKGGARYPTDAVIVAIGIVYAATIIYIWFASPLPILWILGAYITAIFVNFLWALRKVFIFRLRLNEELLLSATFTMASVLMFFLNF